MYRTTGYKSAGRSWIFHDWCIRFLWNGPLRWLHCESFPVSNVDLLTASVIRCLWVDFVICKLWSRTSLAPLGSYNCKFKVTVYKPRMSSPGGQRAGIFCCYVKQPRSMCILWTKCCLRRSVTLLLRCFIWEIVF